MASEWQQATVDAIKAKSETAIAIGPFGSRMKSDQYVPLGIPVIRGNNISDTHELVGEFVYVSPETADELSSSNVFADDLIFPHRGAIGLVGIVPKEQKKRYMLSTSLMKLTCDKAIADPRFIFYFFRSPTGRHQLLKNASTVGTPGIGQPLASLRSIPITLPPIDEQRAIARILGAFDDKIELNRGMNETLEAMARALFKSWFVDFDPVRAKAEGRDPGLPADFADLFPARLVSSDLGPIPEGWKVFELGQLMGLAYGRALTEDHREPGGVAVYGSNGQIGWHSSALATGPGVVIGRKGNPGTVTWAAGDLFVIDTAFFVIPSSRCRSQYFLFHALSEHDLPSLAADSAVPGLNRNFVYTSLQVLPPTSLVARFDRFAGVAFGKIHGNDRDSLALAELRDALLPKLISGEIRVKDAESLVGRLE